MLSFMNCNERTAVAHVHVREGSVSQHGWIFQKSWPPLHPIFFVDSGDNRGNGSDEDGGELILGILGFGESHNNLTRSNTVSREYNISIINFAIAKLDKFQWYQDSM